MTTQLMIVSTLVLASVEAPVLAQPAPGDVFREYVWVPSGTDAGGSLRVGGRLDYGGTTIAWKHDVDLEHATRAEVVIEKLLCHDGTRGLALQTNGHGWVEVPEAANIPAPQWDYQHFIFPVNSVPLARLRQGQNNFALRVSEEHPWKWPQNLIYGVHLRVYYDAKKKSHPTGRFRSPLNHGELGCPANLEVDIRSAAGSVRSIDFLGLYEDANWEGDGVYRQWHGHFFRGELIHHIGTVTSAPYRLEWDTSWVPDQDQPVQLVARITDTTGIVHVTEPVTGLTLHRPGVSVELCKPEGVPTKWVTRAGERSQKFRVTGNLEDAVSAQLVWSSWSPGYMNGIYVNDHRVFDREGPRYAYYAHRVPLRDIGVLRTGENTLKTGGTPRHNGKMVHGMEVNWPGIMVLIRYEEKP